MNPAEQGMTIASMMLCGLGMGLVFDVYRVSSHRFHLPRWLLPILDVLYWMAATATVFNILLRYNQGEVRFYVFLGLGIGVTGYFGLFSPSVIKLSEVFIKFLKKLFQFLWKMVNTLLLIPILWIVRVLAKLLDFLFIVTAAVLLWIFKLLYKPFSGIAKWLWIKLLPVRRRFRPIVNAYRRLKDWVKAVRDIGKKKP